MSAKTAVKWVGRYREQGSRIAFSAIYLDETQASVLAFLAAALAYYARLGIRFKAILTDNGPPYRSRAFAQVCKTLGLKHRFTGPDSPRTNGKAVGARGVTVRFQ